MNVEATDLPGVLSLTPRRFVDDRGYFCETYSRRVFDSLGLPLDFVQDNHSLSRHKGTVRGLHYQLAPFAQDKLVRVVRGAIWDVAVDLRRDQPTYGRHVGVVLSAETGRQLFVPAGFAHGFCTLEDNTEVIYKVSAPYAPEYDRGIAWDDPRLAIPWPVEAGKAVLSLRDQAWPRLSE